MPDEKPSEPTEAPAAVNGEGPELFVDEQPAPVPVVVLPAQAAPPAPPEPAQGEAEPVTAPRFTGEGVCPECGKSGFVNAGALKTHIRFKHDLPRARKAAAERKALGGQPTQPPAPDFSDIPGATAPPPATEQAQSMATPDKRYEVMANMSFDMATGLLSRVFGPEWQPTPDPDNKDVSHERMAVVGAIKNYYASVEMPDIPPGYMLCFVCLAYAAPRLAAPPTKTKLQMGWLWLKSKFGRRRAASVAPVSLPHIVKAE